MSATIWTDGTGYELAHGNWESEPGEWINTRRLRIHRLCAVAWFGIDAVKGRAIHHRINVPWLNVESNLEPVRTPEHSVLTSDHQRNGPRQSVVDDVIDGLGVGG